MINKDVNKYLARKKGDDSLIWSWNDSYRYITPQKNEVLKTLKLTNCEIEYDIFCCQYCNKSLRLDMENNSVVIDKLHLLV